MDNMRASAGRFRAGVGQAASLRPGQSILARAVSLTVILVVLAISLVIIVPIVVLAGIVFLGVLAVLKVRQLLGNAFSILPRDDGRRNVRVRLPAENAD